MATSETPLCLNCGKKLRRYRYRDEKWGASKEWGDYGDGLFCGLRCGYAWGCMYIGRKPELLAALRSAMARVIASRKPAAGPSEKKAP